MEISEGQYFDIPLKIGIEIGIGTKKTIPLDSSSKSQIKGNDIYITFTRYIEHAERIRTYIFLYEQFSKQKGDIVSPKPATENRSK